MKKLFPIITLGTVLILTLSLAFYFVVFLPNKEKARLELEQRKFELEKQKIELQQTIDQENLKIEQEKAKTPTPKPKTAYDICFEECTNRFSEPKNGTCDSTQRYIYSRTYAKFMCQMTEPACKTICSQPNK